MSTTTDKNDQADDKTAEALTKALNQNLKMRAAILDFQKAKGRHNTMLAAKELLELKLDEN